MRVTPAPVWNYLFPDSPPFGIIYFWCAPRQVDSEKNIKFFGCPVIAGQPFYAACSCS